MLRLGTAAPRGGFHLSSGGLLLTLRLDHVDNHSKTWPGACTRLVRTLHAYLVREICATLVMTVAVFTFVLLLANVLKEIVGMLVSGDRIIRGVEQLLRERRRPKDPQSQPVPGPM